MTLTLAALAIFFTVACQAGDPSVEIVGSGGQHKAKVVVELADTPAKRTLGLMYRKELGADDGMLFLFPQPDHLTFWMKNTEIPLDMIFVGADLRVIGVVADAVPFSEGLLQVPGISQYVLEVNGGFAKRHHIEAGDRLVFNKIDRGAVQ